MVSFGLSTIPKLTNNRRGHNNVASFVLQMGSLSGNMRSTTLSNVFVVNIRVMY